MSAWRATEVNVCVVWLTAVGLCGKRFDGVKPLLMVNRWGSWLCRRQICCRGHAGNVSSSRLYAQLHMHIEYIHPCTDFQRFICILQIKLCLHSTHIFLGFGVVLGHLRIQIMVPAIEPGWAAPLHTLEFIVWSDWSFENLSQHVCRSYTLHTNLHLFYIIRGIS